MVRMVFDRRMGNSCGGQTIHETARIKAGKIPVVFSPVFPSVSPCFFSTRAAGSDMLRGQPTCKECADMELKGVHTPVVTPFDANNEIDYDMLGRVIEFQLDNGISGIIPGGSTGEFYALSPDERHGLARFVKESVGGRAVLTAGCNATTTADVIDYAKSAEDMGYDAILLAPPFYSLPSQPDLLQHFRMVLEKTGLPLVLYNYPGRAGVEIGYDVMDGLADHPRVIAIKESSGDISRVYEIQKRYAGRIQLVAGSDDQAYDYFAWGVTAWIAGAANVAPGEHCAVLNAAVAGDLSASRTAMLKIMRLLQNMESGGYNQKAKYGLQLAGYDCGVTRAPLMPLSDEEKAVYRADYDFMKA